MKKTLRRTIGPWAAIVLGNGLLAFTVEAFIIPHGILMGGTTGIAIVLDRVLPLDTAAIVFILNALLLVLGGLVLGKRLVATTLASSLLYPLLLEAVHRIPGVTALTDNALLASLFGGVLMGAALGMVMRVGSSTGGMDIAALVLHRWTHVPVSWCVYALDAVVIGGQALVSPAESVLYGLVVLVLESILLDKVMILGQAQIQIFVISQSYEAIRRALLTALEAGVTMMQVETGHLGQQQMGVLCVIPHRKLYAATELIQTIDPAAFITVTQVKEVRGRGFTLERAVRPPADEP